MELFLLRHGIALGLDQWPGDDGSRPLTEAGEVEVERVISALRDRGELAVERVLSSPLERALCTAQLAAKLLGSPLDRMAQLASGAEPVAILRALKRLEPVPQRLLLVGHNPDLPRLGALLTGRPIAGLMLDRCGIARLSGELAPGAMKLEWILSPALAL